jgi:predicted ATPase
MITRLQVRNFKSLRNIDISFGPLNVLVGPNMAGKSNILDVLTFLYQAFVPQAGTDGVNYALAQRGGPNEVLWKGADNKLIEIALETTDDYEPAAHYRYNIEIIVGAGGYATVQDESLMLSRDGMTATLLGKKDGPPQFGLEYKNADGKPAGGASQSGASAMQYAHPGWDGYRFRESIRNWRSYHFLPPIMKESSEMASGQLLSMYGQNISAWLLWLQTHSPKAFGSLNEVLRDVFPDILQIKTIPTADGKVHVSVDEKGLKRATNVWQLSDGFLHFMSLLSLIYVPPELSGTVFLIEEPENYIHPRLLETLVTLLRQIRQGASLSNQPLAQILLTTQSPYLVDRFHLEELIWIEKRDGATRAFHPSDKKHLRELVENKDLGLGDLMYAGALGQEK